MVHYFLVVTSEASPFAAVACPTTLCLQPLLTPTERFCLHLASRGLFLPVFGFWGSRKCMWKQVECSVCHVLPEKTVKMWMKTFSLFSFCIEFSLPLFFLSKPFNHPHLFSPPPTSLYLFFFYSHSPSPPHPPPLFLRASALRGLREECTTPATPFWQPPPHSECRVVQSCFA